MDVPEVHIASIIGLMMEAVCTSEMSAYFETMQCCLPEGCVNFVLAAVRT
jgi:hypothetical protein